MVLILNILLFILFLIILSAYSMLWPPDSPWAPWWRTNKKTAKAICELANVGEKDLVYDLGCGDGTLILTAVKEYKAKAVGIEVDPIRYLVSFLRVIKNGQIRNITLKRANFFKIPINEATIVVVYLVPKTLEKLKEKFIKELKPGTLIVSYKYEMNLPLVGRDSKNELRMYKVPSKTFK